jgi:hypothetical protein
MSLLLAYLVSLILTFVVTAMTLTAFLSFTGANTPTGSARDHCEGSYSRRSLPARSGPNKSREARMV